MRVVRKYVFFFLFSLMVGGVITSYLDECQMELLMPVRNLVVLGTREQHSDGVIPVSRYRDAEGINPVHVAQTVRQTALDILDSPSGLSEVAPTEVSRLLTIADYFIEVAQEHYYDDSKFYVWTYNFDYPPCNMSAPWVSGMAQGHVIEVLLAAYNLTDDMVYLETARLAANAMAVPIEYGGVAVDLGKGLWFEGYAKPGVRASLVLNGHNYALSGLYYLSLLDNDYRELFQMGVAGLELLLPEFDRQIWSMYDLRGIPANRKYQRIHVAQLWELYSRTGRELFSYYARKFDVQQHLPFNAFCRVLIYPNRFLVVIFLGNILFVWVLGLVGRWVVRKVERPREV